MPEILELHCGSGAGEALPIGSYDLEIVGVEAAPKHEKYGDGLKWLLKVVSPVEHAGKTTQRIGPVKPTPKNASGKIIGAVLGRPVGDENIAVKDLTGKVITGIVAPDDKGKPCLSMFLPKPKQQ